MQGPNKAAEKLAVQSAPKAPRDFGKCCIQVFVSMAVAQFVLNFVSTMHIQRYASDWIANDNHKINFKRLVANAFSFSPPAILAIPIPVSIAELPFRGLSLPSAFELEIWKHRMHHEKLKGASKHKKVNICLKKVKVFKSFHDFFRFFSFEFMTFTFHTEKLARDCRTRRDLTFRCPRFTKTHAKRDQHNMRHNATKNGQFSIAEQVQTVPLIFHLY